jgi:hypothetical protein
MDYAPYTDLMAFRDFSAFQFVTTQPANGMRRVVRFRGPQQDGTYNLYLKNILGPASEDESTVIEKEDIGRVISTLLQIIEIYTEKYPNRVIRLKAYSPERHELYRSVVKNNEAVLSSLFDITTEEPNTRRASSRQGGKGALLFKKKPIAYLNMHSIITSMTCYSRLFKTLVHIELDKHVQIVVALPARDENDPLI